MTCIVLFSSQTVAMYVRVSEEFRKLITFKMNNKINNNSICLVVLLYFLREKNNYFLVL